ncbi:IS66 family insertion sequence element accessory protein TnpB [Donghicola eburneus]|uniref:IS66 family insertion sequence element accessory protein TnpB n=1 Tax=Donghicola eburneus TaxID=393278 RepID=UPI0008E3B44A|nr:IS66 family insertion sequence element accessory protein TnpB [Donghicola eburneus]SFQ79823.1 IS66 Orf2 like protein [Donghicola eburneus]
MRGLTHDRTRSHVQTVQETSCINRGIHTWDGSELVMAYKRLEDHGFTWPAIRDGAMTLHRAQFEALFAGLDWRKVKALETRRPECTE